MYIYINLFFHRHEEVKLSFYNPPNENNGS